MDFSHYALVRYIGFAQGHLERRVALVQSVACGRRALEITGFDGGKVIVGGAERQRCECPTNFAGVRALGFL